MCMPQNFGMYNTFCCSKKVDMNNFITWVVRVSLKNKQEVSKSI